MRKILFLLLISNFVIAQNEKILVTDLTKIKNVVSLETSKDGKMVVYALKTSIETPEKPLEYDYNTQLYLIDTQNPKIHKSLTRGKESSSQPVFSPDGNSVAFVRSINEKSQIFILPLDGGEAQQVTNAKYGASNPAFSMDGKTLFFNSVIGFNDLLSDSLLNTNKELPLWSLEKPGLKNSAFLNNKAKANPDGNLNEIRAYLEKDVKDKKAKVINRLNFQGEATVEPEIKFTHIYSKELKEGAKEIQITKGYSSYLNFLISPDGKSIIATTAKDTKEHPDRALENKIISLDLVTKQQETLYQENGKSFSSLSISPDNKTIVLNFNQINGLSYGETAILNLNNSKLKVVDFDRSASNYTWSEDSKSLYFTAGTNGGVPLYKMDMATSKIEKLSDLESGITHFSLIQSNKILYAKNDIKNPHELFLASQNFQTTEQISALNTEWLKNKKLSFPEKKIFINSVGQKIEYWVMKPTNFETGKKYPLLLQLHGGPTAMWGPGEASMWHEFQYFTAQGYGIVYPNQRGSGGYGKEFQFSNYRNWGPGPQEDALGAFSTIQKESWVDTSKLVITGGSYAGYLTAWIIAHDHRFKAAFAQRGVYDLTTFMGEGNAWRLTPNYFGLPWEEESKTKIIANSPYTFVDKIKTPLLIKHGENDLRTGVIQSEMMFKSLKYLGKDVEYVRMPGATHELSRTGNIRQRIDRILRIYEFFERYIRE
jgi:dipeptidyl aminopeptidase/acylaminoacyl peptidase